MPFSSEARAALIDAARVELATLLGVDVKPLESAAELEQKRGVFVTLKTDGRLRGCIGCFEASEPVTQTVRKMTRSALTGDPRFADDRITPDELSKLQIEISVLTPLELVDDYRDIKLGVDGIQIVNGLNRGCFLPCVATDHNLSLEEFLSMCASHKAGLTPDAWREDDTKIYRFQSEVVSSSFDTSNTD